MLTERPFKNTPLQELLCEKLDFTMEDLASNQQGRITPAQVERFITRSQAYNHTARRFLAIYVVGALIVNTGIFILTGNSNMMITLIIISACLLPGMLPIWFLFKLIHVPFHRKMLVHLREHKFERAQGELRIYRIGSKRLAVADSLVLSVGERGFSLTNQQYEQLRQAIPRGQQAVAYYIPISRWMILSLVLV